MVVLMLVLQVSSASDSSDDNFVWNFPIDITFKSSNPFGWPQIVIAVQIHPHAQYGFFLLFTACVHQVYGHDAFGRDVIQGYCSAHVPTTPGRHRLTLPCYSPKPMSKVQSFFSWLQGVPTEYIDASRPAKGTGRFALADCSNRC
jgi:B9 domain-containing protein 1